MHRAEKEATATDDALDSGDDLPLPKEGTLVGSRYRVGRRLGRGGMGVVHEAVHEEIGRRYAIKLLRRELASRPRSLERFVREARLLAGVNHPHITQVFDFGRHEGRTPYIVMEYLEGRTLREVLRREGPCEPQLAVTIMRQVCRAMAHAHAQGVVHRDLKPDNLMLLGANESVHVKILDFGIAQYASPPDTRLTPSGAVLGTSHYMSPEQTRGDETLGAATDVYSLGVIFYEILSGLRPHPGDSYAAVLFHLLTQPPVPLTQVMPSCPPELWEIIERCLCNNPLDRYATAGELLGVLDALGDVAAAQETRPPGSARPQMVAGKLRFGLLSAGLVTGAVAGSLVTLTVVDLRRPPQGTTEVAATAAVKVEPTAAPAAALATVAASAVQPASASARSPAVVGRSAPLSGQPSRSRRVETVLPGSAGVDAGTAVKSEIETNEGHAPVPAASNLRFLSQNPYD
jgi:tRNA A-37 threonylcarbamoyl transferase component Bud32